jgi:uncharacterized integral membrane protein
MDFGHGAECLCRKCCEQELGQVSQEFGFVLLGIAVIILLGICVKEKFNFKKIFKRFF